DINQIISIFFFFTLGLFNAVLSLASFSVILWKLSTPIAIPLPYHHHFILQGDMVWFALTYSLLNTYLTFKIGRPLIHLSFLQQRFEAFFRYHLMRIRENSEQIALYKAEKFEQTGLQAQFNQVISNFILIIRRQRLLALFTNLISLSASFVPTLLALPGYFARKYQLGGITQITRAFSVVNDSLGFFISNYLQITVLAATAGRLQELSDESLRAEMPHPLPYSELQIQYHHHNTLILEDLSLFKPDGCPLFQNINLQFKQGENTLIMGPSGVGKSTLFRAISGIWPYASGKVIKPEVSFWFVPQKSYLPQGTLRDIMVFPDPSVYDENNILKALAAVHLSHLISELSVNVNYAQMLSLGEQQRLAFARLLIHQPRWILLDEASSSLDEAAESQLYQLLQTHLPESTFLSIGHRSSLGALHSRKIILGAGALAP
ncbi:MAG: ATP-binding cassette domain-containing protein, partial [Gammaproteobacteria bacterium]|nr:ATP-binding cassette domain-containing protein [Gammaproteobacteria bacterium]